jgi:hypothetical protein
LNSAARGNLYESAHESGPDPRLETNLTSSTSSKSSSRTIVRNCEMILDPLSDDFEKLSCVVRNALSGLELMDS